MSVNNSSEINYTVVHKQALVGRRENTVGRFHYEVKVFYSDEKAKD